MIKLKRYKAIQNSPKRGIKKDSIYFSSPSGNKFSENYIGNEKVYINSYDNYIETCDVTLDFIEYLGCLNRKIFLVVA